MPFRSAHRHIYKTLRFIPIRTRSSFGHLPRAGNDHGIKLTPLRLVDGRDDDLFVSDQQIGFLQLGQLLSVFGKDLCKRPFLLRIDHVDIAEENLHAPQGIQPSLVRRQLAMEFLFHRPFLRN